MARRRAQHAPAGLTSNGILLVNVLGLLSPKHLEQVRACLPGKLGNDWFLGVPVRGTDASEMLTRLDDAAAEAVAKTTLGSRVTKTYSRRSK